LKYLNLFVGASSYNLILLFKVKMASKRKVNLTDYELTTTLGTGSFGRVMLCKNKKSGEFFAMKRLKKADIIKLRQVDHVISENTILADIDHPFLVSYQTNSNFYYRSA
jgi:protein kinase A